MTLKLPRTLSPEVEALLRDGEALAERMLHTRSQKIVARELHTTAETMKIARDYHGIPTRPANMPPPPNIAGMDPREVLADHNLKKILMDRAYSKAGVCPPYCAYYGLKTCPKAGKNIDALDDEEGAMEMHRLCPIKFYLGDGWNGSSDSPLLKKMRRVAAQTAGLPEEKTEEQEETVEPERDQDTPDTFRAFLNNLTEGGQHASDEETRE